MRLMAHLDRSRNSAIRDPSPDRKQGATCTSAICSIPRNADPMLFAWVVSTFAMASCMFANRRPARCWQSRCTLPSPPPSRRRRANTLRFSRRALGKISQLPGFGNWFRDRCNEAGLPKHCAAHGLRKAACRRLAEAGCSASVIASISGHATLAEVARYTKAADQERMARDGMAA